MFRKRSDWHSGKYSSDICIYSVRAPGGGNTGEFLRFIQYVGKIADIAPNNQRKIPMTFAADCYVDRTGCFALKRFYTLR
jgi:hypothetical protein